MVALVAAVLAAPAGAQSSPPISFADSEPLTTTCAAMAKTGVELVVHNDTADPLPLRVFVGRVTDEAGKPADPAKVCGGLEARLTEPKQPTDASAPPTPVAAGADAVVRLGATATGTGTKTYTATVAIVAPGGVARRTLTISEQVPAGKAALPFVASRDVSHQRFNPCDDWVVWLPVKLKSNQTPALAAGDVVGVLTGEQGSTVVTVGEEKLKRLTDETSLLPLHIAAVGAGKYSGKVDLTPLDDKSGDVTLALTAKHWWPLAVLFVAIGIGLALLVQWLNGYVHARGRLLRRVGALTGLRDGARDRLVQAAQGLDWGAFTVTDADVERAQKGLREEVGRRTERSGVVIDPKIVDDLAARIDAVEREIGALDTIATAAPLLDEAIARLADERPPSNALPPLQGTDLDREAPRLVETAVVMLKGKPMTAAAVVERAAAIAAMTAAVRSLSEADRGLAHYWTLANELASDLPTNDRPAAAALKVVLEGLRHAFWDAGTPKEVDEAIADFKSVRDKIEELWPLLPDERPLEHYHVERFGLRRGELRSFDTGFGVSPLGTRTVGRVGDEVVVFAARDADLVDVLSASAAVASQAAPPPSPSPSPRRPLSEAEAAQLIDRARDTQWLVLAIALFVAVITALSTLYVGNAWGTPWDYVFAAAWGLITQTAIAAVAGALGGLGAVAALRHGVGRTRV